jgi:hypothetical protein
MSPLSNEQWNTVVNRLKNELSKEDFNKLGAIEYYKKTSGELDIADKEMLGLGEVNIRILNAFPLKKDVMKRMMNISDPFIGLTGDQSFSEGLCLGKAVLYQEMAWKSDSYKAFVTLCLDTFGKESPLYQFAARQDIDSGNEISLWKDKGVPENERRQRCWEYLLEVYKDPTKKEDLINQAKKMSRILINQHSLQDRLPNEITEFLKNAELSMKGPKALEVQELEKPPEKTVVFSRRKSITPTEAPKEGPKERPDTH